MPAMNIKEWTDMGWDASEDGAKGYSVGHKSDVRCTRCGESGPWTLRVLSNGVLAHRDYAVCRCGEIQHIDAIWPNIAKPTPK